MEFKALTQLFYLPHQIVTDFDKIQVSRKLRSRAFKRRKNRQNRIQSDGVNGLQKVGRNLVLKKNTQFCAFLSHFFQRKNIWKKSRIFIYTFFFVDHPNIYLNFFFSRSAKPNIYLFIFFLFFFWKNIYLFKKKTFVGKGISLGGFHLRLGAGVCGISSA